MSTTEKPKEELAPGSSSAPETTEPSKPITQQASEVVTSAGAATGSAATGVKDTMFSMFGGGAKKEKKKQEDDVNEPSGSSKTKAEKTDDTDERNDDASRAPHKLALSQPEGLSRTVDLY